MATPIAERTSRQEIEPTEQEQPKTSTLGRVMAIARNATRQVVKICTGEEYKKGRRLTATYTAGSVLSVLAIMNAGQGRSWFESNNSIEEQTISDAAYRATGTRLNVHCGLESPLSILKPVLNMDAEEGLETRGIIVPNILNLSEASCKDLMDMNRTGEIESDRLPNTQRTLRLITRASVIDGDILNAETPGEINCVATQYHIRVAEEQGLTHSSAFNLQMAEVAGYDARPSEAFQDYAIPPMCTLTGSLDANVQGGVLPQIGTVRQKPPR